ncbi:MAG: hypothetical protein FIB02_09210 [Desulfuromonas sp.]|nr:hypothetical protein [Desulfuromonas sp.]
MYEKSGKFLAFWGIAIAIGFSVAAPRQAFAHCDTLDGPVVADARTALDKADITPVLKWIKADDEQELREAFTKAQAVRKLDPAARDLADTYFFETLVRVHRAGEGAPYTGLKSAGTVEPVIVKADQALEKGSVNELAKTIAGHTEAGIRERFQHALETKQHARESVAAGRDYVAAYVTYVHYVEGIVNAVHAAGHHGESAAPVAHQH